MADNVRVLSSERFNPYCNELYRRVIELVREYGDEVTYAEAIGTLHLAAQSLGRECLPDE